LIEQLETIPSPSVVTVSRDKLRNRSNELCKESGDR